MKKLNNKKKPRASGFIHIGEIIPGVLTDIERRIKEDTKMEKTSNRSISIACIPDLRVK